MKKTLIFFIASLGFHFCRGQNVGIGTNSPSNKLTVNSPGDPARLIGLQNPSTPATGTLVSDESGVLKVRNANTVSAIRVTGSVTLTTNNTSYFNNQSSAPTEVFDNFNEFSDHTFTPQHPGLYWVSFAVNFNQRSTSNDGGDGYIGYINILAGTPSGSPSTAPTYTAASNKIATPEASGAASFITVQRGELIKLSDGEVVQFQVSSYGSSGNINATYSINILRVD